MFRSVRQAASSLRPVVPARLPSFFRRSISSSPLIPECRYQVPEGSRQAFIKELAYKGLLKVNDLPRLDKIPEDSKQLAAVASDGAGTSGDPYGRGTKTAMSSACFDLFRELNITWDKPLYDAIAKGIDGYMGSGKLDHFTHKLRDLLFVNPALQKRYHPLDKNGQSALLLKDAKTLVDILGNDGVRAIRQFSKPVTGFKNFADHLNQIDMPLVLQSAYSRPEVIAFEQTMFEGGVRFAFSISSSDVKNSRPSPEMLQLVCKKLNIFPHQLMVLGDTDKDMLAVLEHGSWGVAIPDFSARFQGVEADMTPVEVCEERRKVACMLAQHGAHYTTYDTTAFNQLSIAFKLKEIMNDINRRLLLGQMPNYTPPTLKKIIVR